MTQRNGCMSAANLEETTMQLQGIRPAAETISRRSPLGDRIIQGLIVGSGVAVLLMLAWVHLGLGALLFPPAATSPEMVATAGPYVVTLHASSGQFVTGDGNAVSFDVRDRAGHPIVDAMVRVHADMTTMAMPVPDMAATARDGRYNVHLVFSMAGPWQLVVTVTAPGQVAVRVTFAVGVRWR